MNQSKVTVSLRLDRQLETALAAYMAAGIGRRDIAHNAVKKFLAGWVNDCDDGHFASSRTKSKFKKNLGSGGKMTVSKPASGRNA